jgi:hypothetical protein
MFAGCAHLILDGILLAFLNLVGFTIMSLYHIMQLFLTPVIVRWYKATGSFVEDG